LLSGIDHHPSRRDECRTPVGDEKDMLLTATAFYIALIAAQDHGGVLWSPYGDYHRSDLVDGKSWLPEFSFHY
jgi:hypothetical protein